LFIVIRQTAERTINKNRADKRKKQTENPQTTGRFLNYQFVFSLLDFHKSTAY